MTKIKFNDGEEIIVNANNFTHDKEHHLFLVHTSGKQNNLMIPDALVKYVGTCNEEGEFI